MTTRPLTASDISTAAGFTRHVLGINLYDWQRNALDAVTPKGSRTALRTCNEAGKTSTVIAGALLWNAFVNPGSTGVTTSAVYRQVEAQCWPSLKRLGPRIGLDVLQGEARLARNDSRIIGFTAVEGGRFEGFHVTGKHQSLMLVIDEAKTVKEDIFQAAERCRPDRFLIASSPGGRQGPFYRAFTKERNVWNCLPPVTVDDCPHIPVEHKETQLAKWGDRHPLVRSMLFAEWMDTDDGLMSLVLPDWIERCIQHPPPVDRSSLPSAGLDFAAGGDENVIAILRGNHFDRLICWRDTNTMAAVGRIVMELKRAGIEPDQVFADATGLGHPMCDRLTEVGWPVHRVNFGEAPFDREKFADRGTEIWNVGARYIEQQEVALPDDRELESQLCARRQGILSRGVLKLQSKEDLRKLGEPSPDRADAVMLALAGRRGRVDPSHSLTQSAWDVLDEVANRLNEERVDGCYTG